MKPRQRASGEAQGGSEPFGALVDPATVAAVLRGLREATPAQLAAADALYDELDILVLPPPRAWELWQRMVDALLRTATASDHDQTRVVGY